MQLTIIFQGKSFTVSIESTDTILVLKTVIQSLEPNVTKLSHQGIDIFINNNDNTTLMDIGITESSIIHAFSNTNKSISSTRCNSFGCNDKIAKIIGDCRFCSSKFCSRHRLPEAHQCSNLDSCRQDSYNKNAGKLLGEKCVAAKV